MDFLRPRLWATYVLSSHRVYLGRARQRKIFPVMPLAHAAHTLVDEQTETEGMAPDSELCEMPHNYHQLKQVARVPVE